MPTQIVLPLEAMDDEESKFVEEGQFSCQSSASTASTSTPSSPGESSASRACTPPPSAGPSPSSSRTKAVSSLLMRRGILQSSSSPAILVSNEDKSELPDEPKSPTLEYLDKREGIVDPIVMAQAKVHGRWHLKRGASVWVERLMAPHIIPLWMLLAVLIEGAAIFGGMKLGGAVSTSFKTM